MADLSLTASAVYQVSGGYSVGTAGEAFDVGTPVALDSSDNKYYKSDADSATAARKGINGVAMSSPLAAARLFIFATDGIIFVGVAIVAGKPYVVSANAGKIAPADDLAVGWENLIVAVGDDTAQQLVLNIVDTGVTV